MAAEATASPHVVLFSFLTRGHVPAFLRLAGLLRAIRPGIEITLVSTPRLLASLSLPPASPPIRLRALPFAPTEHGLPAGADSLADLQIHQFITFFRASESLQPAFEEFISGVRSPVCIVADAFFAWTADVARRVRGASHAVFLPGGAFGNVVFFSVWERLPHASTDADVFPLPDFPEVVLHGTQLPRYMLAATGADPWTAARRRLLPQDRRAARQHGPGTGARRPRHAQNKLRRPAMADRAGPRGAGPVRLAGRRCHHPVAGRAPGALGAVRVLRLAEQHHVGSDEGAGAGAGGERPPLPLGRAAAAGVRREGRVQPGVASRRVRGARQDGAAGARVGAAGAGAGPPVVRRVPEPLRVELRPGELVPWRAAAGLAARRRAVFQSEAGGGVGRLRGGGARELDSSAVTRETVAEAVRTVMGEAGKGEEMRWKAASASRALADAWEPVRGSSAESLEGFLRCVETAPPGAE